MINANVVARIIGVMAFTVAFSPTVTSAYTARMAWTAVPGAAGYSIQVRRDGAAEVDVVDVGARSADADGIVRFDMPALAGTVTRSFTVTSYDSAQLASASSNAIALRYADVANVVDSDGDGLSDAEEDRDRDHVVDAGESNPLDPNDPGSPTPTTTPSVTPPPAQTSVPTATVTGGATSAPTAAPTHVPATYRFPLDGWRTGKSSGTFQVADDAARSAVLRTDSTKGDKFSIVYPPRADLGVALPIATMTFGADKSSGVALIVRATDGRNYRLAYRSADGVPTWSRREATFPMAKHGGSGFETRTRDLAADLRTIFGVTFVEVRQAELFGSVRLADLTLSEPTGEPAGTAADEMVLPMEGWKVQGKGAAQQNVWDGELDAPTIAIAPDTAGARLALDFPAPRKLAAAFGTLSLVVSDDRDFVIELRVKTTAGVVRLRYASAVTTPVVKGRLAILPLERSDVAGSDFDLVTLDVAGDVARAFSGRALRTIQAVRLKGEFRVGDVVLTDAIAAE